MNDLVHISAINQICLRVRDTRRSADFYRTLLSLQDTSGRPDSAGTCALQSGDGDDACRLILVEGLPPGDHLRG